MAELKVTWLGMARLGVARQNRAGRSRLGGARRGMARHAGLTAMTEAGLIQSIITMRR